MTRMHRLSIALGTCVLLSSAAAAQSVRYDFDPESDFAAIRTFTFAPPTGDDIAYPESKTTTYDSPLIRERTHDAITAQLQGRGMRRDDAKPDVTISTRRSFKTEVIAYGGGYYGGGPYGPWGWGWGYGYGAWPAYAYEEIVGTLTIDMNDARTGKLLWRGVAVDDVHQTSKPEKRTARVYKEVSKVFKKYPAGSVGYAPVATSGSGVPKPGDD